MRSGLRLGRNPRAMRAIAMGGAVAGLALVMVQLRPARAGGDGRDGCPVGRSPILILPHIGVSGGTRRIVPPLGPTAIPRPTPTPSYTVIRWNRITELLNERMSQPTGVVYHDLDAETQQPSYRAYAARLQAETDQEFPGGFLSMPGRDGVPAGGVRIGGGLLPEFRVRLKQAEASLAPESRAAIRPVIKSMQGITLYNPGHGWGYALDINYSQCPYLIGEAGESELDAQLRPVYDEISQMMLNRPSVIPRLPGNLTNPQQVGALWDRLKEESDAFKVYFSLLDKPVSEVQQILHTMKRQHPELQVPSDAKQFQDHIREQYLTLADNPHYVNPDTQQEEEWLGDTNPRGNIYRPGGQRADRPFTHCDPRDGFMDYLPRELVIALTSPYHDEAGRTCAGLEWGACAMGAASGDLMHFQYVVPADSFKKRFLLPVIAQVDVELPPPPPGVERRAPRVHVNDLHITRHLDRSSPSLSH